MHDEIHPANQRRPVRRWRGGEPLLAEFRQHQFIDLATGLRDRRPLHRLKRPVFRLKPQRSRRSFLPRHLRARIDPRLQRRHLLRREPFTLRRHDLLRIRRGHALDDVTLRAHPAHQQRFPRFTTAQNPHCRVQPQLVLLLVLPVAVEAVVLQNRPHLALIKSRVRLRSRVRRACGKRNEHHTEHRKATTDAEGHCWENSGVHGFSVGNLPKRSALDHHAQASGPTHGNHVGVRRRLPGGASDGRCPRSDLEK